MTDQTSRVSTHHGGRLVPPSSIALIVWIVGRTIFPFAWDGGVLSILDAHYAAVRAETAQARAVRHVLRLQQEITATAVTLCPSAHDAQPSPASLFDALRSALQQKGVAVEVTTAADVFSKLPGTLVDRRRAWELIRILRPHRSDSSIETDFEASLNPLRP